MANTDYKHWTFSKGPYPLEWSTENKKKIFESLVADAKRKSANDLEKSLKRLKTKAKKRKKRGRTAEDDLADVLQQEVRRLNG